MIRSLARVAAAGLIIAAAAAFAIGAALERQSEAAVPPPAPSTSVAGSATEHSSARVFGINLESTGPVTATAVVSVLLAVAILTVDAPWLAVVIAVAMVAFAALDVREILHQLHAANLELAAIAVVAGLLHFLAALAAGQVVRARHDSRFAHLA